MDQSTQVDFPILLQKMRRHNTFGDFYVQQLQRPWNSTYLDQHHSNNKTKMKSTIINRPKSINIPLKYQQQTIVNPNLQQQQQQMHLQQLQQHHHQLQLPSNHQLHFPQQHHQTPNHHQQQHDNHLFISDLSLGSISRERTPPFSSNSSIVSTSYNKKVGLNQSSSQEDIISNISNNNCKCSDNSKFSTNTTQSALSWRRLHMSRAKLKATSTTSELLSGFAMVAMVELQINEPTNVPEWLFIIFAICTTILVAVHIFALMISTYILPNIDAIAKLDVCEMVAESPHERMRGFIELAWAFSTVLGLFLFLVEIAILCWVKFWDYSFNAAIAATIVIIPVLIIFVLFAVHFYHSLVVYKCNKSTDDIQQLEVMKKQLDEQIIITSPV